MNTSQSLSAFGFLLIATTLEVCGDAAVRLAIYNHAGMTRLGLMLGGAALMFGYGFSFARRHFRSSIRWMSRQFLVYLASSLAAISGKRNGIR